MSCTKMVNKMKGPDEILSEIIRSYFCLLFESSSHDYINTVGLSIAKYRKDISFDCIAVYGNAPDTLADMIGIGNLNVVRSTTELTGCLQTVLGSWNGRVNAKTVEVGSDTQNVLGDSYHVPGSSTG